MGLFGKKKTPVVEVRTYRDEYEDLNLAGGHLKERQRVLAALPDLLPLELELVREPENKYDQHAIAVYAMGHQIGYISKRHARMFAQFMEKGPQPEAFLTQLVLYEGDDGDELIGARIFVGFDRIT